MRGLTRRIGHTVLVGLLLLAGLAGLIGRITPGAAAQEPGLVYFPQTGHFLGGAFRTMWELRGGLDIFGYPITEEYIRNSDGKIVQYFERARFELRVIDENRAVVELGLVGEEFTQQRGLSFAPVAPVPDTAERRYFPQTGHTLQGAFKGFWEGRGGAEIFGLPISEAFGETFPDGIERTVQYFQRARFELHEETVKLALLGQALAPCQHLPPRPRNQPPDGPLPEGDGNNCVAAPGGGSSVGGAEGRVYPERSLPGTVLGFEARNYQPNEFVSLWLNLPTGDVRELPYQAIAGTDGGVLIGFRTNENDPLGYWSLVGQGVSSGRRVVAPFRLER